MNCYSTTLIAKWHCNIYSIVVKYRHAFCLHAYFSASLDSTSVILWQGCEGRQDIWCRWLQRFSGWRFSQEEESLNKVFLLTDDYFLRLQFGRPCRLGLGRGRLDWAAWWRGREARWGGTFILWGPCLDIHDWSLPSWLVLNWRLLSVCSWYGVVSCM